MIKSSELRTGRNCVFVLHVHLVFVTKYRRKVFTKEMLDHMGHIFSEICETSQATLSEFEGEGDHVRLLVNYPPKVSISKLVNSLKGVSSRLLRKHGYRSIQKSLWGDHLWSPSYFASSCGGPSLEILRKYIEDQQTPS